MLTRAITPWRSAVGVLLAGLLAIPAAAQAQSFMLPKECQHGATGAEGDDPVVILRDNYLDRPSLGFTLVLISEQPVIEWGITIAPFRGGTSGYSIFTTYTPFLTSSALVTEPSNEPSKNVTLPRPGVMAGRKTAVYDVFPVLIRNKSQSTPLPYAFVDFIPDFVGSSPLTMQADGNGVIALTCVQQNFDGYNITVYDSNHQYLYDGSISASSNLAAETSGRTMATTSLHPDEPE